MYSNWQNDFNGYQPSGNVQFVTSAEEAVMRSTFRPSDNVYFHQDKPVFYRVKVEQDGRKSWAEFVYNVPENNEDVTVSKKDIQDLYTRLEAIEKKLSSPEVNADG